MSTVKNHSRQRRLNVRHFAEELSSRLIQEGIIVHMYQAVTSSSVYIKMDYGACYSIRISDHQGRPKYDYRFNLMMGMTPKQTRDFSLSLRKPRYPRLFFSQYQVDLLVQAILLSKKELENNPDHDYAQRFRYYKAQFNVDKEFKSRGFAAQCHRIYK